MKNLQRTLKKAEGSTASLSRAHERAAQIVVSAARSRVPVRTGRLRSTIRAAKAARRASIRAGRASVPYAAPIHWGWPSRHIRANPFVSDAAQRTESLWRHVYERDLQNIIASVKGA